MHSKNTLETSSELNRPVQTVFVHGLGQTSDAWKPCSDHMGLSNAVLIDLPSLVKGLSQKPTLKALDYQTLYAVFEAEMMHLEKPVRLVGLSLGSELALSYAITHPERIDSLVLAAPVIQAPEFLLKVQNLVFHLMPDSQFSSTGFSKKDFLSLCSSMSSLDFSSDLVSLTMPVLLLAGSKDKFSCRTISKWVSAFPHGQARMINGGAHEINTDCPEAMAEILSDFWKN